MAEKDFDPIAYLNEPRWRTIDLGLDRIAELLDRLGRPQDRLRFVHVAGTNGKGSTCAYIASVLEAAGYRTGLFTSPYIHTFEERIRVDGEIIALDDLRDVTLRVRDAAESMADFSEGHPTEFELMCATALLYFADRACDICVLEVGLGGRWDATNVIDTAEVSVITRIGLDHTAILGDTIDVIAGEKAAIAKPGVKIVTCPQKPDAARVIESAAREAGCPLAVADFETLRVGDIEIDTESRTDGVDDDEIEESSQGHFAARRVFDYSEYSDLSTKLLGSYQPQNAALAIEALGVLRERGWSISDEAIREGIANTTWPGRFEVLGSEPLFIVDGGHNPQGAHVLAESLRDVAGDRRVVFVMGVLADKDYTAMIDEVLSSARMFVTITPDNPRALCAADLAEAIVERVRETKNESVEDVVEADSIGAAIGYALEAAGSEGVVCAFGSLYSIDAVAKAYWRIVY